MVVKTVEHWVEMLVARRVGKMVARKVDQRVVSKAV